MYFIAFWSTAAKIEEETTIPGVSHNLVFASKGTVIVETVVPGYGEVEIKFLVSFLYTFNKALISEDFPTPDGPATAVVFPSRAATSSSIPRSSFTLTVRIS